MSLVPARLNLTIYQGTTFKKELTWKTGNPLVPVNLTGFKFRMQIRARLKDISFILELTTENGRIVISDAVEGKFYLLIDDVLTSGLHINSGVYDIEVIYPDLTVDRLIEGSIQVSPEVTRPL